MYGESGFAGPPEPFAHDQFIHSERVMNLLEGSTDIGRRTVRFKN
jgi:hypothetical protein